MTYNRNVRPPRRRQPTGGVDNLRKQADMTQRTCGVPGCDRAIRSKGYCNPHYNKLRRYGDPLAGRSLMPAAGMTCTVPDCDTQVRCIGLCRIHYDRKLRLGSFDLPTDSDRFWGRTIPGPVPPAPHTPVEGRCILWAGARNGHGYGNFYFEGAYALAHRFAYLDSGRHIPEGYHVDHLCRVTSCVNPAHLEAVTPAENTARANRHENGDEVAAS